FTDPYIRSLKPKAKPYKQSEYAPKGDGRLIVRVLPRTGKGTKPVKEFFYRYRHNGEDKTLSLGRYDQDGNGGKTLAQIRATLRESRDVQRATGDVKEHLEAQARSREMARRKGSLAQLCDAYVESLRAAGKPSADEAEGVFRRYVIKAFPAIADEKASDIEPGHIQRILARMVKAGITRQVNVTRAYLRAAFTFGGKADHDPRTVARDGVLFGLKSNPVSLVPVIREFEHTGERTLSEDELREFWKAMDALPIVQKATLRFNLALACQRPTQ